MVSGFYTKAVEINFLPVQLSSHRDPTRAIVDGEREVMSDPSQAVFQAGVVTSVSVDCLHVENQVA
jgi:hypothetical protein